MIEHSFDDHKMIGICLFLSKNNAGLETSLPLNNVYLAQIPND